MKDLFCRVGALGLLYFLFAGFTFSQELEITEVSIGFFDNSYHHNDEFIELKNNTDGYLRVKEYYLSADKENLAESRITSRVTRFRGNSSFKINVNTYGIFNTYFETNSEKSIIYLGQLTDDGNIEIIDSVKVPELGYNESYAKIDGVFSIQPVGTPELENWTILNSEVQSRIEFQIYAGPNINVPLGNEEFNESSAPFPGFQLGARLFYNHEMWFTSLGTSLVNKYYRLNSTTSEVFPAGTLNRTVKGSHRLGQINSFLEGGIHLTPRISLSIGQGLGLNTASVTRARVEQELVVNNEVISKENTKEKIEQEPSLELFMLLDLRYQISEKVSLGVRYSRDQTAKVESGAVRNRTLEFYGGLHFSTHRNRYVKTSLKRKLL